MTENICKNCGAGLDVAAARNGVVTCAYCGSMYTLHTSTDSRVSDTLRAGQAMLDVCAFDGAYDLFRKAAELDGREPEAYFGMALAAEKVQYLTDARATQAGGNYPLQPICHAVHERRFSDNPDYIKALRYATPEQKAVYVKKAEEIDHIRAQFSALRKEGVKYDCFLCFKVTEEDGRHTEDYMQAYQIYSHLKKSGYSPFFSEESVGERTGCDYEALILYALYTAPCMVIVCSDERYLRTPWVRNEYIRFLTIDAGEKASDRVTIAFSGTPVETLPGVYGKIQGIDLRRVGALDKLRDFIARHAGQTAPSAPSAALVRSKADRIREKAAAAAARREAKAEALSAKRRAEADAAAYKRQQAEQRVRRNAGGKARGRGAGGRAVRIAAKCLCAPLVWSVKGLACTGKKIAASWRELSAFWTILCILLSVMAAVATLLFGITFATTPDIRSDPTRYGLWIAGLTVALAGSVYGVVYVAHRDGWGETEGVIGCFVTMLVLGVNLLLMCILDGVVGGTGFRVVLILSGVAFGVVGAVMCPYCLSEEERLTSEVSLLFATLAWGAQNICSLIAA